MTAISYLDCYIKLKTPPCIAEVIDDEVVIINLDTGSYYNLRGKSTEIWRALNNGVSPSQLIINNQWSANIQNQLDNFLCTLVDENIVQITSEPPIELETTPLIDIECPETDIAILTFTDMQELLSLDPIHEADSNSGWPNKI